MIQTKCRLKNNMGKNIVIIIPIYNAEKTLERCLNSVFSQTYTSFDVICVNDGSKDTSLDILEKYKKKYKNIYIINQDNQGPSVARNTALDYIKDKSYDFITFIDADDFIDDNYLETLVNYQKEYDADIVCSSYSLDNENRCRRIKHLDNNCLLINIEALNILLEDRSVQSHSPEKLYKKSLWDNVRYPIDIVAMEDQATIYKTFIPANKIYITNYCGYHYWQGGSSVCRSEINNSRVISSLKGYMTSVLDPNLPKECLDSAIQGFINCYLMMYPRYKKQSNSDEFNKIKQYVNKNKLVKKFIPKIKSEKMKKMAYLYARPFYRILFKLFS